MRVTNQGMYLQMNKDIRRTRAAEEQAYLQLASGKRLVRPSDDPDDAVTIRKSTSVIAKIESRLDRASHVESQLATYDTSLSSGIDVVRRLHTLTIQLGNDTNSAADRATAAEELIALRDALRSIANTEIDGNYVFAGNNNDQPAFDATGAYVGDSATRQIELSPGTRMTVNVTGAEAFLGAGGGTDIFAAVDRAIIALQANDGQGIRDEIDSFMNGVDQLSHIQTRIGGRLASVAHLRERNVDEHVRESGLLAGYRDVDLAEAATELTSAQTGVRAALTATARIGQLSLLDLI